MRALGAPTLVLELSGENVPLARAEALGALRALGTSAAPVMEDDTDGPVLRLTLEPPTDSGEGASPLFEAARTGRMLSDRLGFCHHVGLALASPWKERSDLSDDYLAYLSFIMAHLLPEVRTALRIVVDHDGGDGHTPSPPASFTFAVRGRRYGEGTCISPTVHEGRFAGAVKRAAPEAGVDLDSPELKFRVPGHSWLHPSLELGSVDRHAHDERVPTRRLFFRPTSLHPRLARAMVNLAGAPAASSLRDPFCGTGGILIEAAMMGYNAVGSDIDPAMVTGAKANLAGMKLAGATVTVADLATFRPIIPPDAAWVSEPPYGRASSHSNEELSELYGVLVEKAASSLMGGGRLVTSFPSEDLLPDLPPGLENVGRYTMRVHGGLTRHIMVYQKR